MDSVIAILMDDDACASIMTTGNVTWKHIVRSPACGMRLVSRSIGLAVVVAGSVSKLPYVAGIVASAPQQRDAVVDSVSMLSLCSECVGLAIATAFHVRRGSPATAWGECVPMLVCDAVVAGIVGWSRWSRRHKNVESKAPSPSSSTLIDLPVVAVAALSPLIAMALIDTSIVSAQTLGVLVAATFPLFLASALVLIHANTVAGHTGSLSPIMLVINCLCTWARVLTTVVDVDDAFVRFQACVGALVATSLVTQAWVYRHATAKFLNRKSHPKPHDKSE